MTGGTNNVSIPINIEAQATVYAQKFWTYFAQYAPPKSTFSSGPWLTLGTDIGPIRLGITFSLPQAIKALGDLWDGLKATVSAALRNSVAGSVMPGKLSSGAAST